MPPPDFSESGCGQPVAGFAPARNVPIDPVAAMRQTAWMLHISEIRFGYDGAPLFQGASAAIPSGHKVGLVGRNGTGKTTLFRLIRGELELEAGEIRQPKGTRVGGVDQDPGDGGSLLETVLAADTERAALLAENPDDPVRIAEVQTRLAEIGAWSAEGRASAILKGLGFPHDQHMQPISGLSGGWRMRVVLAAALFACPDLLLLDEPTNFLDLEGALWLQGYLANYPRTALIISHDRNLMNRVAGSILHLEQRRLTLYRGGYDQFVRQRAERAQYSVAVAKKQEAYRAQLQSYVDRFRYKADKAKQAQSRLKMIKRMVPVVAPSGSDHAAFRFPEPEDLPPPLVSLEGVSTGYDGQAVLQNLNLRIDQDDRIALLGRNGEGKSTFAKLLSNRLESLGGRITRAGRLRVGYFAQHQIEELRPSETPLEHLARELPDKPLPRLRSMAAGFGLACEQAELPVEKLSGGQHARLSLLLATCHSPHMLVLDEPTNHLDIESREALAEALNAYPGAVILISHDAFLLSNVADRLWLVENGTVRPYDDDLEGYGNQILANSGPAKVQKPARRVPGPNSRLRVLKVELRKCEMRVQRLVHMRQVLAQELSDPGIYAPDRASEMIMRQKRFAEVEDRLDQAENLWLAAQEKLEAAEANPAANGLSGR